MARKLKTIWRAAFVEVSRGQMITNADFDRLEIMVKPNFRLNQQARERVYAAIFQASMDQITYDTGVPVEEVLARLEAISSGALQLADQFKALNNRNDRVAQIVRLTLNDYGSVDLRRYQEVLREIASLVEARIKTHAPKPKRGAPARNELEVFILELSRVYEASGGQLGSKVWISRTAGQFDKKLGRGSFGNKPTGPFFRFVKFALTFVRPAPTLSDEALASRIETARKRKNTK